MKLFKKPKKELSESSKVVIDLIKLIEGCPIENPSNAELALYIAKSCRVIVV